MKNKKKPFGNLKFNKETISNLTKNHLMGGASVNGHSECAHNSCAETCEYNPDIACEGTDLPPHHNDPANGGGLLTLQEVDRYGNPISNCVK